MDETNRKAGSCFAMCALCVYCTHNALTYPPLILEGVWLLRLRFFFAAVRAEVGGDDEQGASMDGWRR